MLTDKDVEWSKADKSTVGLINPGACRLSQIY